MVGSPDKVMPIIGPLSDIFVVSRPKGSGKGSQGKLAREFMLEALRSSSRPTLILPQRKVQPLGKRVLIAWDQSTTSVQALIGALPILKQADDIVLHSAGADYHAAPKASHAKGFLAMHGIKCRVEKSRGLHVEQEIEEAYDDHNADLLVMGAYSRSRFMERVLGGTSEHFIINRRIPVLATHLPVRL
jgi:nucleotide-binding universal stress UspA family protein